MGTGITDVIGGPHDFLPPKSDEFQKLCYMSRALSGGDIINSPCTNNRNVHFCTLGPRLG